VYLLYRRSRKEMPANDIEVIEGEHEEVQYHFLAAPTKLVGGDKKLKSMEYLKMELGEPDASGRRRPVPIEGSESLIEADNVFSAIGQSPNLECLDNSELGSKLERTRWNSVVAAEGTMQSDVPKIFAGGDGWRGAATAVEAIRDGRFAARGIDQLILGEGVETPRNWYEKAPKLPGVDKDIPTTSERGKMAELTVDERRLNFTEVDIGLSKEVAIKETQRCMQCGVVCYQGSRDSEKES
jgi:formate dehydrogenase (NADP+) beta subunit